MVGSLDISAGDGICKGVDHNQKWVTVHKPKEKLIASLTVIAATKKETCQDPGRFRRTPTTVWGEARLTKVAASFRGQGGLFGGSLLAPRVAPLCSTHRDSSGSL